MRPLFARAASDHVRSLKVLQRAGFAIIGTAISFANARNKEIEETILRLDEPAKSAPPDASSGAGQQLRPGSEVLGQPELPPVLQGIGDPRIVAMRGRAGQLSR